MFIFFAIACSKKEDTQNTPDGVPTLNTPAASDISNITATTAVVNASVNLEGDAPVTAKGICWSTSHIQPSVIIKLQTGDRRHKL